MNGNGISISRGRSEVEVRNGQKDENKKTTHRSSVAFLLSSSIALSLAFCSAVILGFPFLSFSVPLPTASELLALGVASPLPVGVPGAPGLVLVPKGEEDFSKADDGDETSSPDEGNAAPVVVVVDAAGSAPGPGAGLAVGGFGEVGR